MRDSDGADTGEGERRGSLMVLLLFLRLRAPLLEYAEVVCAGWKAGFVLSLLHAASNGRILAIRKDIGRCERFDS